MPAKERPSRLKRGDVGDDALARLLATAPVDDEESTEEEDRSAREAREEYRRGDVTTADQLRRELGTREPDAYGTGNT